MAQLLSTLTPILKEVLEDGITSQLSNETTAWNRLEREVQSSDKIGGKYVRFAIHTKRNNGIGSRGEMEALPVAGRQGYEDAEVLWAYLYASIELSGQAIELAANDYQAFAASLSEEKTRIMDDIMREKNRQFFGSAKGFRTSVTASPAGQVLTVKSMSQLDDGGRYDVVTSAGVKHATVEITNYDDSNPSAQKITVTGDVSSVVSGDYLVRAGSYGKEMSGMADIVGSQPLYGIDPSTTPLWKSVQHGNASAPAALSELALTRMADVIKRNGGKTTVMYTTPEILRSYFSTLTSQRRFVNTQKFDSGHSGVAFQSPSGGEVPFVSESDAPQGEVLFLNEKELKHYSTSKGPKFIDRTGSIWRQKRDSSGDYDAWIATLKETSQLATKRRNTHGRLVGVQGDTLV